MSNYGTKGVVNRYWKRPKTRVYECNVRDAERFYQQSYKEYLEAKEQSSRKASEPTVRYGDDSTSRWGMNRSNSLVESLQDGRRDGSSYQTLNGHRSSYLDSLASSSQYGDNSYKGSTSFRASSVSNQRNKSPDADYDSIEQKLQRLQKLRSELGLPSEAGRDSNYASSSTTTSTSRIKTRQISPPSEIRDRVKRSTDRSAASYSTLQSRTRANDLSSDNYGERSSGTEKTVRFSSKYDNDDGSSYTRASERANGRASSYVKDDLDKYSFKSSSKSKDKNFDTSNDDSFSSYSPSESKTTKGFKSSVTRKAATTTDDDLGDYDDDALLSNIKKKFPTSDEILERIKKMDSDM